MKSLRTIFTPSHGMNVFLLSDFNATWSQRPFLELDYTIRRETYELSQLERPNDIGGRFCHFFIKHYYLFQNDE